MTATVLRTARWGAVVASLAASILIAGTPTDAASPGAAATARAVAVRIAVPGAAEVAAGAVSAPPDAVSFGQAYAYPTDGTLVRVESITANASAATAADQGTAQGSAGSTATGISLFAGELTAQQVTAKVAVEARDGAAAGNTDGTVVEGLALGGTAVALRPGTQVPLGDWGVATAAAAGETVAEGGQRRYVTALEVRLIAEHGGYPAGTTVAIGFAEATARSAQAPAPTPAPTPAPKPQRPAGPRDGDPAPSAEDKIPPIVRRNAPAIEPRLTRGGYVFPIYGLASFGDSFGAARATTTWHHGADIFAPLGAPVLAVADGTLFSVGWNDVGGNRLWLRDDEGNEFYYAHMSAFSTNAADGRRVAAGDVVGFVGNTGDAAGTPFHLHFEIHPLALLGLGYDGVINPTRPLESWRRLEDVSLRLGGRWKGAALADAPAAAAYLLDSTDISTANGLEPGSLRRALAPPPSADGEPAATGAQEGS